MVIDTVFLSDTFTVTLKYTVSDTDTVTVTASS